MMTYLAFVSYFILHDDFKSHLRRTMHHWFIPFCPGKFHWADDSYFANPFRSWCIFGSCLALAIVDTEAANSRVYAFVWTSVFTSFEYTARSEIVGSHANFLLCLLKNPKAVFHSSCTILHSHQRCLRGPMAPHSYACYFLFCLYEF